MGLVTGLEAMDTPKTGRVPPSDHVLEAALDVWGQAGGRHLLSITGNSMNPSIWDGDRVLVAHGCTGVRPGDVVVFRHGGNLIAHRVLRIYEGDTGPGLMFVTKGDNASRFDPSLNAGEIVGRVLSVERNGRQMSLDTAAWRMLGWFIVVSTLAWTKLYKWSRGLKRRLLGPRPNRVTAFLRHSAQAFFSLVLRVVQAVACRWDAV